MTTNRTRARKAETASPLEGIIETMADAGFWPSDDAYDFLNDRGADLIGYFSDRAWGAFRLEDDHETGETWAQLVRWSEDGIELMGIDANGCITAEARYTASRTGLAWFARTIAPWDATSEAGR